MSTDEREKVIAECVERLAVARERMLDADFRTFEELRIEIDRELREIGLRLLGLDGRESPAE